MLRQLHLACLLTMVVVLMAVCSVMAQSASRVPRSLAIAAKTALLPRQPLPQIDDPETDGWNSEVISNKVAQQLDHIASLLQEAAPIDESCVIPLATADFSCAPLRPLRVREVFNDHGITAWRKDDTNGHTDTQSNFRYRGREGLANALHELTDPFNDATRVRVQFKIFGVSQHDTHLRTQQYFSINGYREGSSLELHATWDCNWTVNSNGEPPRLRSITVHDHEQVRFDGPGQTLFADCTEAVMGHNPCFKTQLMRGTYDWIGRLERAFGSDFGGFSGLAVGDVNGDDLEDVYLCQSSALPNRLFIQNEDGTVTDRSAWAGVDWCDRTLSALLVDLDNDGDQDLVLSTNVMLLIMANNGAGQFSQRTAIKAIRVAYSLAAADYDHDGDLDIYVCRYEPQNADPDEIGTPIPYYDATNGASNHLLRNDGDWQFTDVTKETGMDNDNTRWSYAASWDDYDNDGDLDLYVANDYGRNCLYRNDNGYFANVAEAVGAQDDAASGMSACWGDYNHDGLMDIYVSNMFSAAGNRIAFQNQFHPEMSQQTKALVQRNARGNSLFASRGDGTFADVSVDAGVTMGRWAWGSLFVDLNNDGWEDLVVPNGFLTADDTGDL